MVTTRSQSSSDDQLDPNSVYDHLVNPSNPLFLHPNENPTLVLVPNLLTEKNYNAWSRNMIAMLESKNKDRFIDGSFPSPPSTDILREPWARCNRMVMSWIMRSVTPTISESVVYFDTAAEIWKDLRDRFSHGDMFRIADLQDEIQNTKQGDSSVTQYFTRLKILWKEMERFRTILTCSCASPCSCGVLPNILKERENDCVIKFLRGLNDEFAQVRLQIMMISPLPSISKSFSLVLQQEREFGGPSQTFAPQDSIAYIVANDAGSKPSQFPQGGSSTNRGGGRTGFGRGRGNKYCSHCGKTNHTIDTCFFKYGFPGGYKTTGKGNPNSTKTSANLADTDSNVVLQPDSPVEHLTKDQFTLSKEQY